MSPEYAVHSAIAELAGVEADPEAVVLVIPGRCEASSYDEQLHIGESRDSGSGPADHPGMTETTNPC